MFTLRQKTLGRKAVAAEDLDLQESQTSGFNAADSEKMKSGLNVCILEFEILY